MATVDLGEHVAGPILLKGKSPGMGATGIFLLLGMVGAGIVGIFHLVMYRYTSGGTYMAIALLLLILRLAPEILHKLTRQTLEICEEGLIYSRGKRLLRIPYDQVQAVACHQQNQYTEGEFKGLYLRTQLWRQDPQRNPKPSCVIDGKFKAADPDLEAFLSMNERLLERQVAIMREKMIGGTRILLGKGALLERKVLRTARLQLPLNEIVACGMFDEWVCFWRRSQVQPCLKLRPTQPNVQAFMALMREEIESRGEEPLPDGSFGRILFRRQPSRVLGMLLFVVGACVAISAPLMLLAGLDLWPLACIALLVGALLGFGGMHLTSTLEICEGGVVRRNLLQRKAILYRDMETFTYTATRQYYNGAYIGTSLIVVFSSHEAGKRIRVRHSSTVRNVDEDLDHIRDYVGQLIAARLHERIDAGQVIPWGPRARISRHGISYTTAKLLGKGDLVNLGWDAIQGFTLEDGFFHLFSTAVDASVLQIPVSVTNFFPCFFLFCRLGDAAKGQANLDEPSPVTDDQ